MYLLQTMSIMRHKHFYRGFFDKHANKIESTANKMFYTLTNTAFIRKKEKNRLWKAIIPDLMREISTFLKHIHEEKEVLDMKRQKTGYKSKKMSGKTFCSS